MSYKIPITPMVQKIVINKTTGKGGKKLDHCYFEVTDVKDVYNFYNQHSDLLAADVVSGQDFTFELDGLNWTFSNFAIDELAASGSWVNDAVKAEEAEEGTFQAQSGGGAEEEEGKEAAPLAVGTAPANAIKIKTVTGGADKDKLKHCYFLPSGSQFEFCDKDGNQLASGLTSGNNFNFTLDSINWSITNFLISDTNASGNWSNPNNIEDAQDGTFQAASGGGADEEANASAAMA